jgi:hypothetical protein
MPGDSSSAAFDPLGNMKKADKRYCSNRMRSHAKWKCERANEQKEQEAGGQPYKVCTSTCLKHVHQSNTINADISLTGMPISAPGYIGVWDTAEQKDTREYPLDDLIGEGSHFKFKLKKWDGRQAILILLQFLGLKQVRKSIPIKDRTGWIFAVGIGKLSNDGQPEEQNWSKAKAALDEEIKEARVHQSSFPQPSSAIQMSPSSLMRLSTPSCNMQPAVHSDGLNMGFKRRRATPMHSWQLSAMQKRLIGKHIKILAFLYFLQWMN